jgi:hypothetical protein
MTSSSRTQHRRMVRKICYVVTIQERGRDVIRRLSRNLFGGNEQKKKKRNLSDRTAHIPNVVRIGHPLNISVQRYRYSVLLGVSLVSIYLLSSSAS